MCLLRSSFGYAACGDSQIVLSCGVMQACSFIGSVVPWEGLLYRSSQLLPMNSLGLPGRNYKAIRGWLLPIMDLEAQERGHVGNRGLLPTISGLGQLNKRPSAPQGLRLSAGCM